MGFRSLVSIVEINKGDKIKKDMVWSKRPGTGIPSYLMSKIIGRYAKKKIKANKLIMWSDLI